MAASTTTDPLTGLSSAETTKPKYDWHKDIPADALDAKDFSNIDAWLDACIAQNRPGKIGPGTYAVEGDARYAPKGIYGYGDPPPKFVAEKTDCWLYLKNGDVTLKGLQFEGFGQVLGGAVALQDGAPYHSTTKYGFDRFMPAEDGGTALTLQLPASAKTVGPNVTITDCVFVNGENAFTFVSDTVQMGKVEFHNNELSGTYGMLDIDSLFWTEVNASGNEWANATGERVQPNLKQNGVQTGFKIGTDHYVQLDGHTTKLSIVNNYAHDIQSVGTYLDTNAAVFVDVRGAIAKNQGDNEISFNRIEKLQGLKGQEDSNAIYAKAWGLVVQGNYIAKSGAAYVDAKHNGSETTGVLVKPMTAGVAKDIQVIGNTFVDMPTALKGVWPDLSVVKISEAIGNSAISFNNFIGGGNLSGSSASGIVRWFGDYENVKVVGNNFKDVALGEGDNAIVFHQGKAFGVKTIEVSNNSASKTGGDYTGDKQLVFFSGERPAVLISGYNVLDGGHKLGLSLPGTKDALPQAPGTMPTPPVTSPTPPVTSPKPPVTSPTPPDTGNGNGAPAVLVTLKGYLAENTKTETLIADLLASTANVAVSVDDARFVVKNSGIYLKGGQTVDFEAGTKVKLTLSIEGQSGTTRKIVEVPVGNVDEAPTAVLAMNVKTLASGTAARTLVADLAVMDPDRNSSFLSNTLGVDDGRFEIADGHLYLKAGQTVDPGTISLTLTATGAGGSVESHLDVAVLRSVSVGTPTPGLPGPTVPTLPVPTPPRPTLPVPADPAPWAESERPTRSIAGTGAQDTLYGTSAAELIDGRDREDIMAGGAGDDTYVASGYRDIVIEAASNGIDTVIVKDNRYFLPAHVENLIAQASDVLLVGNGLANMLIGSAGDDIFVGAGGSDLIRLGAGSDLVLYAPGDGSDTIEGFGADDRLSVGGAEFGSFAAMKAAFHQEGADAVLDLQDGSSLTLKNVAAASLTAAQLGFADLSTSAVASAGPVTAKIATAAGELVSGTAGHDFIDGRGGADLMAGGTGDDTYVVDNQGDRIVEDANGGTDTVLVRAPSYALDVHVENARIETASGAAVQGNASANLLIGGLGADILNGGGGNDKIDGGFGTDTITGGDGQDILTGGLGADVFVFAHESELGDTITDFVSGFDRIDVTKLLSETGGTISTADGAAGTSILLQHDGAVDLVAMLTGVHAVKASDLLV